MKTNYNHGYNHGPGDSLAVSVEALWPRADQFLIGGAFVPVDATYTVGKKIPAGTPVGLDKMNGTLTLGSAATSPVGLTYEDVWVGTDGVSIDIVTHGTINESLMEASVTTAQKDKLTNITFFKEA